MLVCPSALVDITCTLLLLNPDFTTAWNVRYSYTHLQYNYFIVFNIVCLLSWRLKKVLVSHKRNEPQWLKPTQRAHCAVQICCNAWLNVVAGRSCCSVEFLIQRRTYTWASWPLLNSPRVQRHGYIGKTANKYVLHLCIYWHWHQDKVFLWSNVLFPFTLLVEKTQ